MYTMEFIKDGDKVTGLRCLQCKYRVGAGKGMDTEDKWEHTIKDHISQHSPGRAPDLEWIRYELSSSPDCTICPDGGDVCIIDANGTAVPDGLICYDCGTTWNADGDNGETRIDPEDKAIEDPNQLKLFEAS